MVVLFVTTVTIFFNHLHTHNITYTESESDGERWKISRRVRDREIHRYTNQFSSENPIDATVISPTMKWHKMKANDSTIPMQYAQAPKHTYANYGIDIFIVVKIYALFFSLSVCVRCCCCCLWKSFTAETL